MMSTIIVNAVTEGWPVTLDGIDDLCTIDITIDGKYVRMGYPIKDIVDSATVRSKLTEDIAIIKRDRKQQNTAFPFPVGGMDRPDLVPADFVV